MKWTPPKMIEKKLGTKIIFLTFFVVGKKLWLYYVGCCDARSKYALA